MRDYLLKQKNGPQGVTPRGSAGSSPRGERVSIMTSGPGFKRAHSPPAQTVDSNTASMYRTTTMTTTAATTAAVTYTITEGTPDSHPTTSDTPQNPDTNIPVTVETQALPTPCAEMYKVFRRTQKPSPRKLPSSMFVHKLPLSYSKSVPKLQYKNCMVFLSEFLSHHS